MDLGRPLARHTIRRPHEAIDLDAVPVEDAPSERVMPDTVAAPEQPARSEQSDH